MWSSLITALIIGSAAVNAKPISTDTKVKRQASFDYDNYKVRGVNLGGWFVLEPFINPSMFEQFDPNNTPVDERRYCEALGKDECFKRLDDHWNTWIQESDISSIAGWGFNHIRIPIGYWAFQPLSDDPYVQGQTKYLDRVLGWASNYGLNVIIDLHGAPGSQNGFDNSGYRDQVEWPNKNGDNIDHTLDVLSQITSQYGKHDSVVAIELLNEPLGTVMDMDQVKQFFQDGYHNVRDNSSATVVIHDAFQQDGYFNNFMQPPEYNGVLLDHHKYQVFSPGELSRSIDDHIDEVCNIGRNYQKENHWRITGEWSAALTDCTKWLNGVGRGARYTGDFDNSWWMGSCDNNEDIDSWSDERKDNTRKYIEAQMQAYDQGTGWVYWNYKTENSAEWDAARLINAGLFPKPSDNSYQYENICGF